MKDVQELRLDHAEDEFPIGLYQDLTKISSFPTAMFGLANNNVSEQCLSDSLFYVDSLLTNGNKWAIQSKSFSILNLLSFFISYFTTCLAMGFSSVSVVRATLCSWRDGKRPLPRQWLVWPMSGSSFGTLPISRQVLHRLFQVGANRFGRHWTSRPTGKQSRRKSASEKFRVVFNMVHLASNFRFVGPIRRQTDSTSSLISRPGRSFWKLSEL